MLSRLRHGWRSSAHAALLLLVLAGARPARAQDGFNLAWDECGAAGHLSKTFACDNNSETFSLVVSVQTITAVNNVYYAGFDLDFRFDQPTPSTWWPLTGPSSCRLGALSGTVLSPASMTACTRSSMPGYNLVIGNPAHPDPYTTRVRVFVLTDQGYEGSFAPGGEIFVGQVDVSTVKTVGAGACSGCGIGACISVTKLELWRTHDNGIHRTFYTPLRSGTVAWQGGSSSCAAMTGATRPTWGAIKQLYR